MFAFSSSINVLLKISVPIYTNTTGPSFGKSLEYIYVKPRAGISKSYGIVAEVFCGTCFGVDYGGVMRGRSSPQAIDTKLDGIDKLTMLSGFVDP